MTRSWHKVPSDQPILHNAVFDQIALPAESIPLQHFERLSALSQKGSSSEHFTAKTCYTYTYVWRYFLGALARSSPKLLELSPESALAAGLEIYYEELAVRKRSRAAIVAEFGNFTLVAAIIVPDFNREMLQRYKRKLAGSAGKKPALKEASNLALEQAELSERDHLLMATFLRRSWPSSLATSDMQARSHLSVVKASAQTAGLVYAYRLLLGTIKKHAPDLMSAPDSIRFGSETIQWFITDMMDPERPAMILMRLRKLHVALTSICQEFNGASILKVRADQCRSLIKAGVIAPSPPAAARLPVADMPKVLMRHLHRRCASTVRNRRILEERLKHETRFISPSQRHQGRWKLILRPATVRQSVDALRAWAGFLRRNHPVCLAGGRLTRLTPDLVEEFVVELRRSCEERSIAELLQRLRLILFRLGRRLADLEWLLRRAKALRATSRPRRIWSSHLRPRQIFKASMAAFDDARTKLQILGSAANVLCSRRRLAKRMRDSLMIALESLVLLRVRNLAGIGWKTTLDRAGDCFKLSFSGTEMKNGRDFRMMVPIQLTAALDYYIHAVRCELHPAFDESAMWVSTRTGRALGVDGRTKIVRSRLFEFFGIAISTHRFRNIGLTAAANFAAHDASLPMKLAGHTSRHTSERCYITAALNDNRPARLHRASVDQGIKSAMEKIDARARTAPMLGIIDEISFLPRPERAGLRWSKSERVVSVDETDAEA